MKWEYKIVNIAASRWTSTGLPNDIGEHFDQWGNEGGELVKVEPVLSSGWFVLLIGKFSNTRSLVAFFKRPKAS